MSTVYLIHGFLGVGKTTLALRIAEHGPAVRLSADEWYIALFGHEHQVGIDVTAEARMRGLMWKHWPAIVAAGADLVLDMGFWTRADRDRARAICADLGAEVILFEVVTEERVALQRCLARNESTLGAFFIDQRTYSVLRVGFEPLEADEPRVTVHT